MSKVYEDIEHMERIWNPYGMHMGKTRSGVNG
jgi:hypothetical protein